MPQPKKHPSTRARANKATTSATLVRGDVYDVPDLPDHPGSTGEDGGAGYWHAETLRWWRSLWASPLPGSWEDFDLGTLLTVALLYNDIWTATSAKERKEAAGEFRLQRKDFFIAPYDRLRGEITMEEADEARTRGNQRRQQSASRQPLAGEDPRLALVQ